MTSNTLAPKEPVASPECWMIIPAAGIGQRMGGAVPKQYLKLQGKSLLEWTLAQCLHIQSVTHVWVAVNPADTEIDALDMRPYHNKVSIIRSGGESRLTTVLNTLNALQTKRDCLTLAPWVLVHDAVRPCLQADQVETLLAAAGPEGALLAYPIQDTVKRLGADHQVEQTLDRNNLWLAQTPQMAAFDVLLHALNHAHQHSSAATITDEAAALEAIGLRPKVVLGSLHNRKLTRPEDLEWFADYLATKASAANAKASAANAKASAANAKASAANAKASAANESH